MVLCAAHGHLLRAHVLAAQAAIERLEAERAEPTNVLFDGAAIESFEPGLPMLWVAWFRRRSERLGRVAVVGRQGPMLAVAATFRYLLPTLRYSLFKGRGEALAFLRGWDRTE